MENCIFFKKIIIRKNIWGDRLLFIDKLKSRVFNVLDRR